MKYRVCSCSGMTKACQERRCGLLRVRALAAAVLEKRVQYSCWGEGPLQGLLVAGVHDQLASVVLPDTRPFCRCINEACSLFSPAPPILYIIVLALSDGPFVQSDMVAHPVSALIAHLI